jgi:hypothetical protein
MKVSAMNDIVAKECLQSNKKVSVPHWINNGSTCSQDRGEVSIYDITQT